MSAPTFNTKPLQIGLMLAFLVGGGGYAVLRTLSLDDIGPNGLRCVLHPPRGVDFEEANRGIIAPGANLFDDLAPGSLYIECKESDQKQILNIRLHPFPSIIGAIAPYILLSPLAYWLFGFSVERIHARMVAAAAKYKTCSYCAERIEAEAKACRHCGRDIPA
jgi:hypothetical protein